MKQLGNKPEGSLDELMKKAVVDPLIDAAIEGRTGKSDELLVVANGNQISVLAQNKSGNKWAVLQTRTGAVNDFAIFDGKLYDCGNYPYIMNSLGHDKGISIGPYSAKTMCAHNGDLYYSGELKTGSFIHSVNRTFEKKYDNIITNLRTHNGKLIHSDSKANLCESVSGVEWRHPLPITALYSDGLVLYFAYGKTIMGKTSPVQTRLGEVSAICTFNDHLIDAGGYGIRNTITDEELLPILKFPVTAMIGVPDYMFSKELLKELKK